MGSQLLLYYKKDRFQLLLEILQAGVVVGVNSLFVLYFVMLISFIQCAKKLFTVINSASMSAFLSDLFSNFIGKTK